MQMTVSIRPYQNEDLPGLMCIYRDAVISVGPEYYSPEQVQAWSAFGDDKEAFRTWMDETDTYVAIDTDGKPLGFAGLEDKGRVASLYVAPGHMRQGIGRQLLIFLQEVARQRGLEELSTDASEFSKPLFESSGFIVQNLEETRFNKVVFNRYQMVKRTR